MASNLLGSSAPSSAQTALLNTLAAQMNVEGPVTNRLFVASLDYKVDEAKLREVFAMAGQVLDVSLFKERDSGRSRGMAVVEFVSPFEALNAVSMFNHQQLLDRQMTVRFDTKPPYEEEVAPPVAPPQRLPSGLKSIGSGLASIGNFLTPSNNNNNNLSNGNNRNSSLSPNGGGGSSSGNNNNNNGNNNQQQSMMAALGNSGPVSDFAASLGINMNGSGLGNKNNYFFIFSFYSTNFTLENKHKMIHFMYIIVCCGVSIVLTQVSRTIGHEFKSSLEIIYILCYISCCAQLTFLVCIRFNCELSYTSGPHP